MEAARRCNAATPLCVEYLSLLTFFIHSLERLLWPTSVIQHPIDHGMPHSYPEKSADVFG